MGNCTVLQLLWTFFNITALKRRQRICFLNMLILAFEACTICYCTSFPSIEHYVKVGWGQVLAGNLKGKMLHTCWFTKPFILLGFHHAKVKLLSSSSRRLSFTCSGWPVGWQRGKFCKYLHVYLLYYVLQNFFYRMLIFK